MKLEPSGTHTQTAAEVNYRMTSIKFMMFSVNVKYNRFKPEPKLTAEGFNILHPILFMMLTHMLQKKASESESRVTV